ncbi:MAG: hypothetical protein ACK5HP_01230 [Bacilli bacterium]
MKKISLFIFTVSCFFISSEFVLAASEVSCGGVDGIPAALPIFTSNLTSLVKLLVPIILIIMGMLDMGKAVMSNDEKGMKESQSRFIRRILAAVIIFFIVAIVQFVFGLIQTEENILGCVDIFINGGE